VKKIVSRLWLPLLSLSLLFLPTACGGSNSTTNTNQTKFAWTHNLGRGDSSIRLLSDNRLFVTGQCKNGASIVDTSGKTVETFPGTVQGGYVLCSAYGGLVANNLYISFGENANRPNDYILAAYQGSALQWVYHLPDGSAGEASSLSVFNGVAYFIVYRLDAAGETILPGSMQLIGLNLANGTPRFTKPLTASNDFTVNPPQIAVGQHGLMLLWARDDDGTLIRREYYDLNSNLRLRAATTSEDGWHLPLGGARPDGTLYIDEDHTKLQSCQQYGKTVLHKYAPDNKEVWAATITLPCATADAVAEEGDGSIVALLRGHDDQRESRIVRISAAGQLQWTFPSLPIYTGIRGNVLALADGRVVVLYSSTASPQLESSVSVLSPTGKLIATQSLGSDVGAIAGPRLQVATQNRLYVILQNRARPADEELAALDLPR
jgi:hypothetical protein